MEPVVNPDGLKEKWPHIRHLLRSYKKEEGALEKFTSDITTGALSNEYPKLVAIALTVPMSSVACERAFSTQNRIKTKFRSRLSANNLQNLMTIATARISIEAFDFGKAIDIWQNVKERRI